jgi:metal-dependent amidase/aminoacylase/carboxypeptidase family protein
MIVIFWKKVKINIGSSTHMRFSNMEKREKMIDSAEDYAKMFALVADIEAEKAYLEGMKWENARSQNYDNADPTYSEDDFANIAHRIEEIAEKLREDI